MDPSFTLTRREQVASAVFAVWCVSGLFLDGWSHQASKPETFFTPWHGLLYSGFGAAIGFGMYESNRARLRGEPPPTIGSDRLTQLGAVLFGLGIVGDFVWHELFGIEVGVDALLSPTHLTLMTGGIFLASIALRHAMADGPPARSMRTFLPVLASATATTAVVAFFLQYASAYDSDSIGIWLTASGTSDAAQDRYVWGTLAILATNAILVGLTTLLSRWGPTPYGTHTVTATVLAVAGLGMAGFSGLLLALPAAAGGLAADLAVRSDRRDLAGVAQAVVTWPLWFAAAAVTFDVGWSANPIGGVLVMTVLTALFLRTLTGQRIVAAQPLAPSPSTARR